MGKSNLCNPGRLIVLLLLGGMAANEALAQPKQSKLKSILVMEHGAGPGYVASCDHLNAALRELGSANGFTVKVLSPSLSSELEREFSPENLAKYQVVIFAYNDGVHRFVTGTSRDNFEKYVENGGGFLAINAASAFIEGWRWMDSVLVQKFYGPSQNHFPAADLKQDAEGLKLDSETRGIGKDLIAPNGFKDAFYQFQANPRGKAGVTILLTVDETSSTSYFNAPMGADHPVAWIKTVGKGRVVHNSLGFSLSGGHNAYTQKGDYLKNFTYNTLRYAAGDFLGCMDNQYAEFNPDATKNDPAQCATPTTALVRFNNDQKQSDLPLVSQNETGTLVYVEFFHPGPNAITIADVTGKLVYLRTGSGQANYSVPTPKQSGIYFVKAKAGGKISTYRVTVL